MDKKRFVLSDPVWARLAPLLPGKASDSGVTAGDNRLFLEAVFWRVPPAPGLCRRFGPRKPAAGYREPY